MNVYKTIAWKSKSFLSSQYIFFFTNLWSSIAKIWPHTCGRKAVPGHNILMVTKFFLIPRLCSPMASLYLALILLTLSSSFTVFFSLLCFTPEVQQTYYLTVLVLLDNLSAFSCLSLFCSLYFFQLAFTFLEHKQSELYTEEVSQVQWH